MGVNDYGGPTDSLAAVPLGGVGGWAESVAAALDNSDTPIDDRLPTAVKNYVDGADATLTFAAPFIKRSGHRAAFRKAGGMILCQMSLDVTANVTSSGTTISVGTIPAGYRPAEYAAMSATWVNTGSPPGIGLLVAYPDGQFRFLFANGQTLTPGTHIAASGSWPPA